MSAFPACMYVDHVCVQCPQRPEEGTESPRARSEAPSECPVLSTAEPSLQPTLLLETKPNCPGAHQFGKAAQPAGTENPPVSAFSAMEL